MLFILSIFENLSHFSWCPNLRRSLTLVGILLFTMVTVVMSPNVVRGAEVTNQRSLDKGRALLPVGTTSGTTTYPPVDRDKATVYFEEGNDHIEKLDPFAARDAFYKSLGALNIKVHVATTGLTNYDTDIDPFATDQEIAGSILGRIEQLERLVAHGRLPASYPPPIHALNGWIASTASIKLLEAARSRIDCLDLGKKLQIGSTLRSSYNGAVFWGYELKRLISYVSEPSYANAAFLYADRARSRVIMDFLAAMDQIGDSSLLREWYIRQMVTRFLTWSRETPVIDRSTLNLKPKNEIDMNLFYERNALLESENRRLQEVQHKLDFSNHGLIDRLEFRQAVLPSFSDIQRALRPREALLEYHITESSIFIFVVKQYGDVQIALATRSSQEITDSAIAYSSILSSKKERPWKSESNQLYMDLIKPVATSLQGCNRLVIVPDGVLHAIPFQSLVADARTERLLLDDYTLRYISSASLLIRQNKKKANNGRAMVLAINQFAPPRQPLPESEKEAIDIVEYFKDRADPFLGSKSLASKEILLNNAPNYEFIHISSHGRYDIYDPIMSYIILQGQNLSDERLSAFEILTNLFSARLVVLSACESYFSHSTSVSPSGDLFGPAQAFILSGAQSVIASAWKVTEGPTRELMKEFYARITQNEKLAIDIAIKEGQIAIRRKHPHPYNWAAFVVYGCGD